MHLLPILRILALLSVANGAPVIAAKLLARRLQFPLDCGLLFPDGRPLLGPAKTVRGVVASVLSTSLIAPFLGLPMIAGSVTAISAMAGDALSSFCKRRLGLASSTQALGLDQIPESLLPMLAVRSAVSLSPADIVVAIVLFLFGELIVSQLLFAAHLRDRPY